jgi:serine/threonine protein kinase
MINLDKYGNFKDNSSLMEEVHLCQRVTSENIVKIYDVVITLNNIHIILERCDTDLYEYIMKCPKQRIEEKKAI